MENCFRAAQKALKEYIARPLHSQGPAPIAITHLVARSLTDLGWGQYLASSGYPIQMYSVIRPVREAINLIDLFAQKPERAQDWVDGKFWSLTPKKVRDELGIEDDAVYSWMAEHSHPRFAGLQLTTYKMRREGEEGWRNVMYLDELPFELLPVLIATAMPGLALMDLASASGHVHISDKPENVAVAWASMLREVAENLEPGFQAVSAAARPEDLEDDEMGTQLAQALAETLEHARDLEKLAANAVATSGSSA